MINMGDDTTSTTITAPLLGSGLSPFPLGGKCEGILGAGSITSITTHVRLRGKGQTVTDYRISLAGREKGLRFSR